MLDQINVFDTFVGVLYQNDKVPTDVEVILAQGKEISWKDFSSSEGGQATSLGLSSVPDFVLIGKGNWWIEIENYFVATFCRKVRFFKV